MIGFQWWCPKCWLLRVKLTRRRRQFRKANWYRTWGKERDGD